MRFMLFKGFLLAVILVGCVSISRAEQATILHPSSSTVSAPSDPLGRGTPRSAIFGFIEAAHQGNYALAARYFQTTLNRTPRQRDEMLAQQLMTVLDLRFIGTLYSISNKPNGEINDSLPPNLDKAGEIRLGDKKVDLILIQVEDKTAGKIWLISSQTLSQIPEFLDVIHHLSQFEKRLPSFLVEYQLLSMPLWQWVAFILLYFIAFAAAWLAMLLLRLFLQVVARLQGKTIAWTSLTIITPVTLLLTVFLHYLAVNWLGAPILYREYYTQVMVILTAILLFWFLLRITDHLAGRFAGRAEGTCRVETRSLLMLGRRVFKVMLFIVITLFVLRSFGVDVTTALAGLGIGGLVLGFGAQKTVENLFGGVSVLTDRVLHVGDFCKVGDQLGTIEDIGLRSTRIRRVDRTLVAIPNGTIANATVENYSMREKILFKPTIGVRYETSADQLRHLLAEIRQMLYQHPKVESAAARTRLVGFGESSIAIEIFAYVLTGIYAEFLAIQEDLLLRIMDIVESSGTSFAFPSQTMYLSRDTGLDPAKVQAAEATVQRWREDNLLPFPDHHPDTIAQLENTLEYPPPESSLKKEK